MAQFAPFKEVSDAPVRPQDRLHSLDLLRGFAVLGIFAINVYGYGHALTAYFKPMLSVDWSDANNRLVWAFSETVIEGSMRALLSILFGAGVILFTARRNTPHGSELRPVYFRRTLWLLVIGLVHGYLLLWPADVLVYYGAAGLLLWFARNWNARRLIAWAAIFLIAASCSYTAGFAFFSLTEATDAHLRTKAAGGETLAYLEAQILTLRDSMRAIFEPTATQVANEVSLRRGGYQDNLLVLGAFRANYMLGGALPYMLLDALGMMLLGMALLRLGVLEGARRLEFYFRLLLFGYGLGVPINLWETVGRLQVGLPADAWVYAVTYNLGRLLIALGHISLLLLIWKSGALSWLCAAFAAVGRMALTNYIGQSVIAIFIFSGVGFGLVGRLSFPELYGVVIVVSLLQLMFSVLWLKVFRFGPLEWIWRGLTYLRFPPIR